MLPYKRLTSHEVIFLYKIIILILFLLIFLFIMHFHLGRNKTVDYQDDMVEITLSYKEKIALKKRFATKDEEQKEIKYLNAIKIFEKLFVDVTKYENDVNDLYQHITISTNQICTSILDDLKKEKINTVEITKLIKTTLDAITVCYDEFYDNMGALSTNVEMLGKDLVDNRKNIQNGTLLSLMQFDKEVRTTLFTPPCRNITLTEKLHDNLLKHINKIKNNFTRNILLTTLEDETNLLNNYLKDIKKYQRIYDRSRIIAFEILGRLLSETS